MLNDNVRRMLVFGRQLASSNPPTNPPPKKN
jgi:hypothetical protein